MNPNPPFPILALTDATAHYIRTMERNADEMSAKAYREVNEAVIGIFDAFKQIARPANG